MDFKDLGQSDAEHLCGQSDGAPPSLTHLPEPGAPAATQHQPNGVVEHQESGPLVWTICVPSQAAPPALGPAGAVTGPDPPPHWKHCGTAETDRVSSDVLRPGTDTRRCVFKRYSSSLRG